MASKRSSLLSTSTVTQAKEWQNKVKAIKSNKGEKVASVLPLAQVSKSGTCTGRPFRHTNNAQCHNSERQARPVGRRSGTRWRVVEADALQWRNYASLLCHLFGPRQDTVMCVMVIRLLECSRLSNRVARPGVPPDRLLVQKRQPGE